MTTSFPYPATPLTYTNPPSMVAVSLLSIFALCATAILAAPGSSDDQVCAGSLSDSEVAAAEAHFAASTNDIVLKDDTARKTLSISVYWHVIHSDTFGRLTASQIKKQLAVLNKAYKPAGLDFQLKGQDYSNNQTWFQVFGPGNPYDEDVKKTLHKGTKRTLNIYSTGFSNRHWHGLRGYSTFPWAVSTAPVLDGVAFRYSTIPGGVNVGYNEGKTLVHEVGHWLGLYHTFQGGCGGRGDYVSDTPDQEVPGDGCPVKQDSCPRQKGLDPVHNYMDTSSDSCRTEFTKGQIKRLRAQIAIYRGIQ